MQTEKIQRTVTMMKHSMTYYFIAFATGFQPHANESGRGQPHLSSAVFNYDRNGCCGSPMRAAVNTVVDSPSISDASGRTRRGDSFSRRIRRGPDLLVCLRRN